MPNKGCSSTLGSCISRRFSQPKVYVCWDSSLFTKWLPEHHVKCPLRSQMNMWAVRKFPVDTFYRSPYFTFIHQCVIITPSQLAEEIKESMYSAVLRRIFKSFVRTVENYRSLTETVRILRAYLRNYIFNTYVRIHPSGIF